MALNIAAGGVDATLIELNPEYVEMAKRRLGLPPLVPEASVEIPSTQDEVLA